MTKKSLKEKEPEHLGYKIGVKFIDCTPDKRFSKNQSPTTNDLPKPNEAVIDELLKPTEID